MSDNPALPATGRRGASRPGANWFFYPDNPQDRGVLRSGRHEGDCEMRQVGHGARERPQVVTFAQHSWRQGCGWSEITPGGPVPVAYVAHASHSTYPRR